MVIGGIDVGPQAQQQWDLFRLPGGAGVQRAIAVPVLCVDVLATLDEPFHHLVGTRSEM